MDSERVPRHHPGHQRTGTGPTRQATEASDLPQRLGPLLKFEMPQVLLHDVRHGHPQGGRKILRRHGLLLFRVGQKASHAIRQILRVTGFVKFNCQFFSIGHLPEVREIGAHNRHTIGACQVSYATAPRGRRIWHNSDR